MSRREARRSGGRRARVEARLNPEIVQKPALTHAFPHYEIASPDLIEEIHQTICGLLANTGIEFHDEESLDLWREAGAKVDGQRVRIPQELLMDLIGSVPSSYQFNARNPERTVTVGGRNTVFANKGASR